MNKEFLRENKIVIILIFVIIILVVFLGLIKYIEDISVGKSLNENQSLSDCKNGRECFVKNNSGPPTSDDLTEDQKKLSPDLLQLLGIIDLPPDMTQDSLIQQMINDHQLKQIDGTSGKLFVQTYIYLNNNAQIPELTNYLFDLKYTDLDNHILVAWIDVNNVTQVASYDTVREISTIVPPESEKTTTSNFSGSQRM
jgi:hypothetical protein